MTRVTPSVPGGLTDASRTSAWPGLGDTRIVGASWRDGHLWVFDDLGYWSDTGLPGEPGQDVQIDPLGGLVVIWGPEKDHLTTLTRDAGAQEYTLPAAVLPQVTFRDGDVIAGTDDGRAFVLAGGEATVLDDSPLVQVGDGRTWAVPFQREGTTDTATAVTTPEGGTRLTVTMQGRTQTLDFPDAAVRPRAWVPGGLLMEVTPDQPTAASSSLTLLDRSGSQASVADVPSGTVVGPLATEWWTPPKLPSIHTPPPRPS